ncbi:hypothetical protein QA639_04720 [Bradyrhizobium pachyrhizi]|uniref:hypothetical protein n=1 Tax=Bradyrhizobium pachyrhizi TaxID=280333 RepID=UPI0024B1893A|nr:hypothetical protein [Bradyrhizobium pachyrhizi]WFU56834.1 hypothetical protein QA639_04720 [Bradyrhizobium pachyrhizi]
MEVLIRDSKLTDLVLFRSPSISARHNLIIVALTISIFFVSGGLSAASLKDLSGARLSPHQMNLIAVTSQSYKDGTYKFASLAFALHNADNLFRADPSAWMRSFEMPVSKEFDLDYPSRPLKQLLSKLITHDQGLQRIAEEKASRLDHAPAGFARNIDTAVEWLAGKGGIWGQGLKMTYPTIKGAVLRDGRQQRSDLPNLAREFVIDWTTWGCDQIREGTPVGKALAPYATSYLEFNPQNDLTNYSPVEKATVAASKLLSTSKPDDLASEVGLTVEAREDFREAFQDYKKAREKRASIEERAKNLNDRAARLEGYSATFRAISYALDAQGAGADVGRWMKGVAKTYDGMAGLARKGPTMSAGAALNAFFNMADGLTQAIHGMDRSDTDALKGLFDEVRELADLVRQMRDELMQNYLDLGQKLSSNFRSLDLLANASNYNAEEIKIALVGVQQAIDAMRRESTTQATDLAGIIFRGEERKCSVLDGEGRELAIRSVSLFRECRDIYSDRATIDAVSSVVSRSKNSDYLAYFGSIDGLRQMLDQDGKEYPNALVNPSVWYAASGRFLDLFRNNPDKLQELSVVPAEDHFPQLDRIIRAGQNLQRFTKTALVDEKGRLKEDRLALFIETILSLRGKLLSKIEDQIENKSAEIDPLLGFVQPYDKTFPFELLSKPLTKCENAALDFKSYNNLLIVVHGPNTQWLYVGRFNDNVYGQNLGRLDADIKNLDFRKLRLDASFIRALPSYVPLVEQFNQRAYVLSPCVSKLALSNLSQSSQATSVDADISIDVNVRRISPAGYDFLKLVTMRGSIHASVEPKDGLTEQALLSADAGEHANFFGTRVFPIVWERAIFGKFDKFLKSAEDQKSSEVRSIFEDALKDRIVSFQDRMRQLVAASFEVDEDELSQVQRNLISLSKIGLDDSLPSVRKWEDTLADRKLFKSPREIIAEVLGGGSNLEKQRKELDNLSGLLSTELDEMSRDPDFRPPPDPFANRIGELEKLRFIRLAADRGAQNRR